MIYAIKETKNGFVIDKTTTREEILKLFATIGGARCIICNENMAKTLQLRPVCINKKLEDGVFYINGVF